MASSYKFLAANDRVVSTTELTEAESIISGSSWTSSSYSYSFSVDSSSVNVFDVTIGRSPETTNLPASASVLAKEKAIYNQFAKILLGHDSDSSILKFSLDSDSNTANNILHNAFFLNFARSQTKDKIKDGTFQLKINVNATPDHIYLVDKSGSLGPTTRACQTGEYGILYVSGGNASIDASANLTGGLVFYEAGIVVISPYIFSKYGSTPNPSSSLTTASIDENQLGLLSIAASAIDGTSTAGQLFFSGSQAQGGYAFARNIQTASFQSVTELNSAIYFCRAFNNEFNYSSNPTYLSQSQIYVKNGDPTAQPVSYITTVGLYSDDNQLLAVAKLSEPIKKTPETELIARVRLDF